MVIEKSKKEELNKNIEEIAKTSAIRASVTLLKRHIGIEGEINPDKTKVERIKKAFENALNKGTVKKDDVYWKEFNVAKEEMSKYLSGKIKKIGIKPQQLNGVGGGRKKKSNAGGKTSGKKRRQFK